MPEAYQQVDYLENIGNSYIKTGVIPTLTTGYSAEFEITEMTANPGLSSVQTGGGDKFGFIVGEADENRRLWYANNY